MQNRAFRSFIAWFIILGLVVEVIGCSTFQQVENWKEYPESTIRVETRGGTTYKLEEWKVAASGDITVKGEVRHPKPDDYFDVRKSDAFRGTIPADSIAIVEVWKTDWVLTSVIVLVPVGIFVFIMSNVQPVSLGSWGQK